MKSFFLYRLFIVSKLWFVFCIFFILSYLLFFLKKMDSVFTPYNGMFAYVNAAPNKTSTIAIKLDDSLISYTHNLWWRKDFLENSIIIYSRYILHNKQVFLNDYINQKPFSSSQKEFLHKRLTPDSLKVKSYSNWLVTFLGQNPNNNSTLEFVKYDFNFMDEKLFLADSTSLFKIKISNGDVIY